jgi:hypothetical protein
VNLLPTWARNFRVLGIATALTFALMAGLLYARGAIAQSPPAGAGQAQLQTAFACGREEASVIRTWETSFTTMSTSFVDVPAAALNITIPAGSDCIVVTFNGHMNSGPNFCIYRAFASATEMSPTGGRNAVIGDGNNNLRTIIWAEKVTVATTQTVLVKLQVMATAGQCTVDDWVLQIARKN